MSSLGLIIFMTRAEVIRKYRIPKHLHEELFAEMPVATMQKGRPLYHEHQVDCFFKERFSYPTPAPYERVQSARPRGGRKVTTDHEAIYALDLKSQGMSVADIATAMKNKWPLSKDRFYPDAVRKCMERYEKRQARRCDKNLSI